MDKPILNRQHLNVSFDLRLITLLLLAVIAVMLIVWKPWSSNVSDRTIQVVGEASLSAEPDEFVFYPAYQFVNDDKNAALAAVSSKSSDVVAKLKELGVSESGIKTNSSGYDFPIYPEPDSDKATYTLQLEVTVNERGLAQKVQDYLITTTPSGSVSPQANFSDDKRRELESKARDEATKEARKKAEQSARNLGFKIGKVKSVEDGTGFGDVKPFYGRTTDGIDSVQSSPSLEVQPGQNELTYTVTVTYYLR